MTISEVIRFLCKKQNMSVSELARRLGQTRQNLSKKLDRETLTVKEINQIAAALGGKFDQIFTLSSGMTFNTSRDENIPKTETEIISEALWNFSELGQTKDKFSYQDLIELLDFFRDVFNLDSIYILELFPDNSGMKFTHSVYSNIQYDLSNIEIPIEKDDFDKWIKLYEKEPLSTESNPKFDKVGPKSHIHLGVFHEGVLFGCIGFMDYHTKRKWSIEEKSALLRLGRSLHTIMTANRLDNMNKKAKQQMDTLMAMSDIYLTVHIVNLVENTTEEVQGYESISRFVSPEIPATRQMKEIIAANASFEYRDELTEFTDFSTLDERMKNLKSITYEFRSLHLGWIRTRFIAVERDSEGHLVRVALTNEVIDSQKKKMDKLLRITSTDELTQVNNRHAYEEAITELEKSKDLGDLIIAAFDVNGLKKANDEIGHSAGDELIKGSAFCITVAFGLTGTVFRTGGDEFMCLIHGTKDELEELKSNFMDIQSNWHGSQVKDISISAGYVIAADHKGKKIHELLILADKEMYSDKSDFYTKSGKERRRR